ncbi:uncharacterized protein I303_106178 [Kwoniella dejecticola CBS 10117]|uniref:Eisosome component PIL1-domain-containing protein n=1 Tax=Kwoniella dejecticola CBS 10117 TaxID=1296121 RepID=A0A1A6A1H6_9TREE|nr:uncharacterized protein I303_06196 [Kwoniella dejecticola CBS 10117]OBR83911.1 hypothetical protein I303_06196 [Kwoniella dejecticola CBS 10117]
MTLRNTSGKFSLSNFGRKVSGAVEPNSPTRSTNNNNNNINTSGGPRYSDDESPSRETHSGNGAGFDGFGKKLKGTLAHQSILPGLGNKDMRALQDIITTEKGVMQMAEKLAADNQKASASLPPYGVQEGPDLQDILTQSSNLLSQLTTALTIFANHQGNMRSCLKRIREREELLMDLRSRRRNTGNKADQAERKLAKMGPENKQLPQQTELLEKLRLDMRNMDQDIVTEETKIGDFKRQVIKEALSLKFGGLEELGEKMCIIGELGKLLLEEVPLEETPVGYGRAPYTGYEKTENAVNEATRCLSTVQFHASNSAPKPPGLPDPPFGQALRPPSLPREREEPNVAAAEEYANYPGNVASPDHKGKGRDFSLDTADPYGGITHNPYDTAQNQQQSHIYSDFGGHRRQTQPGEVMFNHDDHRDSIPQLPPVAGGATPGPSGLAEPQTPNDEAEHGYEYEQQKAMDAEEAWKKLEKEEQAWKEAAEREDLEVDTSSGLPNPHAQAGALEGAHGIAEGGNGNLKSPWEPLNVKRGNTPEPYPPAATHQYPGEKGNTNTNPVARFGLGQPVDIPSSSANTASFPAPVVNNDVVTSPTTLDIPPVGRPGLTPAHSEFYTPTETLDRDPLASPPIIPAASASGSGGGSGGRISAAAFRKGTKPQPRASLDPENDGSYTPSGDSDSTSRMIRRLPIPPMSPSLDSNRAGAGAGAAGIALPASPAPGAENSFESGRFDNPTNPQQHHQPPASPPPGYQPEDSLR